LIATIANLLAGLREDGFSSVYVLIPTGLDWASRRDGSELPCLPLPQGNAQHANLLPGLDIPGAGQDKVVIISIGHTEQHGYHLPLSTDTIIVDAIAQGIVDAAPGKTTRLPAMPYGVSTHRPSFAGTFNAGGRVFEDFWLGVIDGLARRGFDRFYLISGHGGNCSFLVNVVKYAGERHRRIFCSTAWLYLSGTEGVAALEAHRRSRIGGMGHAGELETSLMLHLRPDLVHMEKVVDETDFIATPSYYMDWVEGGSLIANPPWDDDTRTGAYGAGSLATPENGALWLEAAIAEKVTHVAEIDEQQERREERRNAGYGLWGHYDEKRNRKT
jgi:creatinine amidohydrolase